MKTSKRISRQSLTLLTDLYELTMAYGYWKLGMQDREAAFHLSFRQLPFEGGYAVACGLNQVTDYLLDFHFSEEDTAYLATLTGNDGRPLFTRDFLEYLKRLELSCNIHAMPEGTVVFPHEPIVRVTGPLLQCQVLESALLNMINFQTLIATKAARICLAAEGDPVMEFGLRRAQGIDGGVSASRAAYVGGCAGTSNVLAGKLYDIPVKGTHAHSWVMVFDSELKAFRGYAEAMPNNCIFLVDTYDVLQGVRHAVTVGKELRRAGHEMVGIRIDSGDLAYLSIEAQKILEEAGFGDKIIVGSSDLDEYLIESIKDQHAPINSWGVGTRLATAFDNPALGGVYKLTAVKDAGGRWEYKVKLSEQLIKVTTPGVLQVRRYNRNGDYEADAVYDIELGIEEPCVIVDPMNPTRRKRIHAGTSCQDLLVPIFREGQLVYNAPSCTEAREHCLSNLASLHPTIKRLLNPHEYPAGLEVGLHDLKLDLVSRERAALGKETL
ncbi:MAG TPA: nicotinate phosphoribosyltransferase, partial [Desulfobacteraceae bacterium]|nr:nicotinate phosphoribosyltransferase [Desulfobacteraceae bacterium]